MTTGGSQKRSWPLLAAALLATVGMAITVGDAAAQWWPFGNQEERPPVPREPVRPPRGQQQPPAIDPSAPPQRPGGFGSQPGPSYGSQQGISNICFQLEQRLVAEVQGAGQGREMLPKIEADMRELERSLRTNSIRLERSDCWDTFLFSKTLRNSARCRALNDDVENARHRLADLDRQRGQILGSEDRSLQDDIIRELARNGCGDQYVREARKRDNASNPFAMLFGSGEDEGPRGPTNNNFGNLPFATYRTLCVRLCDGYYFPVSFSTLPNHFQRDAQLCQSQCAAPAELFYHQNPGGSVEQMVSFGAQQPYTSLKSAFRYRKEFVRGCSCKQAEYNPATMEQQKAEAAPSATEPAAGAPAAGIKIGAKR